MRNKILLFHFLFIQIITHYLVKSFFWYTHQICILSTHHGCCSFRIWSKSYISKSLSRLKLKNHLNNNFIKKTLKFRYFYLKSYSGSYIYVLSLFAIGSYPDYCDASDLLIAFILDKSGHKVYMEPFKTI